MTTAGTAAFTYDSIDRIATRNSDGFAYTLGLLDPSVAGAVSYSRSPAGRLQATHNGTDTRWVGLNRHGDSRWLFDTAGATQDTTIYDPYGDPIVATGTTGANVGFQGDWTDPDSGDVWMGARWYTPATGGFRSRDTYSGRLEDPVSLNRYTYALNNPLKFFDPDGRCPNCGYAADAAVGMMMGGYTLDEAIAAIAASPTMATIEAAEQAHSKSLRPPTTASEEATEATFDLDLTHIPILVDLSGTEYENSASTVRLEYVDFTKLYADTAKEKVYASLGHCLTFAAANNFKGGETCSGYAALHKILGEVLPQRETISFKDAMSIAFNVAGTIAAGVGCGLVTGGAATIACAAVAAGALTIGNNAIAGRDLFDGVAKNMAVGAAFAAVVVAAPVIAGAAKSAVATSRAGSGAITIADDVAAQAGKTANTVRTAAAGADDVATGASKLPGGDLTRVGRWMSPDEHAAMLQTGEVQVGSGGTTYVSSPPNVTSYMRQASPGSHYVEFSVPTNSLFPAGRADWAQIPGPQHILARLAAKRGTPVSSPVSACNIVHVATKLGGGSC